MRSSGLTIAQQKSLVGKWRETGRILEARRRDALARQSPEQSRQAAFDMLHLGGLLPPDSAKDRSSGLIEAQRLFARAHRRGRP